MKSKNRLHENIEVIVLAILIVMIVKHFIIENFHIPSGSMFPTVQVGDYVLINKFIYGLKIPFTDKKLLKIKNPEYGDIVVVRYSCDPETDYIKRIVGLPGDTVEMRDKAVYLNNKKVNHNYCVHSDKSIDPARDNHGPVKVPNDSVFVLGDNRDESYDSRELGFVKKSDIKGNAFFVYWSWKSEKSKVECSRVGKLVS